MSNLAVIGGWFILRRLCSSHVDVGQFKIFWVWYGSCCCPTNHSIYMYAQLTLPNQPCFLTSELIDALTMCVHLRIHIQHIYFWSAENYLVYLGIPQMKFQTTATIRWRFIAQWIAFHFPYHTSHFPMSQPTAAKINLCASGACTLGFA